MVEYKIIKPEALSNAVEQSVFSRAGISRNAGMSQGNLCNLCHGTRNKLKIEQFEKLVEILGVNPDSISESGTTIKGCYEECQHIRPRSIRDALNKRKSNFIKLEIETGIDRAYLYRCDNEKELISNSRLKIISDYLGLPITFFLPPEPEPEHLVEHKGAVRFMSYNDRINLNRNKRGEPKKCHGCRYRGWAGTDSVCDYINITKRKRGCTVAACNKYEPKKPKEKYNQSDKIGDRE